MPLTLNQLLHDRYRIDALLGEGGMGAVYDAWDTHLNVRCAIKENLLFTEVNRRQFEREAQLLARLHHPNLPRVTDHFSIPNQGQYLVMDFVEGEDLQQRVVHGGPLPEADVSRWADDVLSALAYLHKRHIVHRDIKPANLKINADGAAMLVDFGIAKETGGTGEATTAGARGMTPGYAPPEQYGLSTGTTDARSDIYAFGATLYALLTGEPPMDSLSRVTRPEKFAPLSRQQTVSGPFASVIDKALEMEPEARFASAEDMLSALHGGQIQTVTPAGTSPPMSTVPPSLTGDITQKNAKGQPTSTVPTLPGGVFRRAWLLWGVIGTVIVSGLIVVAMSLSSGGIPISFFAPSSTPTVSQAPTLLPSSTPTLIPTSSPTPTPVGPTATSTPSPTLTPTITRTPAGGGFGKIAFVSNRDGNNEIYVMNVDGSNVTRLTDNTVSDTSPAWSPDSSKIAFVSKRDGNSEIYVMNADGTGQTRLTSSPDADFSPSWSPDGQKIAFASARDGNGEIYVMNIGDALQGTGGSEPTRLTNKAGDDFDPVWSPDGAQIAFVSNRLSSSDIYLMNVEEALQGTDGNRPTRLTSANGNFPAWSPDGTRLAYIAKHGPKVELYVIGLARLTEVRLTDAPAHASSPGWSPDGTRMVFVSDNSTDLDASNPDQNEIYAMNADGSGVIRLTENEFNDNSPAWSP